MSSEDKVRAAKGLSVISICVDEESRGKMWTALQRLSGFEFLGDFQHYLGFPDDQSLIEQLKDRVPDVCVLDFDRDREQAVRTAERLQDSMEGRLAVFAASARSEPDLIISAMRCGCVEYLVKPLQVDRLREALLKVATKRREQMASEKKGRVITLLPVKGGSGVTTLAIHLGSFLARMSRKVVLIDQHPDLGDAAVYLGFNQHRYHFYELASEIRRLDEELVRGFTVKHDSGLELLASPEDFGSATRVSPEALAHTLEFLRSIYQFIVLDCAPGLTGFNSAILDRSDEVYLVATPEVPSIRNLARYLEHLNRYSFPADRTHVVINRYSKKGPIVDQQIEKAIRKSIRFTIPNSYAEVIQAVNTGTPLSPNERSDFVRAIQQWAQAVVGTAAGEVSRPGKKAEARKMGILGL